MTAQKIFRIETGRYRPVRIDIAGLHGLEIARPGRLGREPGKSCFVVFGLSHTAFGKSGTFP
jgi:hypothetical protein